LQAAQIGSMWRLPLRLPGSGSWAARCASWPSLAWKAIASSCVRCSFA